MSLSLSRHTELGFKVDLLNFCLGCVTLQLMRISLMLALVGAAFCYTVIVLRSCLDSQVEIGSVSVADHLAVDIDSANRADDGYEWIKYGQKQVQGNGNSRSYYEFAHPNCSTKMKGEKSLNGHITDMIYKGSHSHPKSQSSTTSSSSSSLAIPLSMDSSVTPDQNASVSMGDEFDEDEPDGTRWKIECETEDEGILTLGSRTTREPRVVVHTCSDVNILDGGYRWWKYGRNVVKGNPNPRSYYKCRHLGCPVRKFVQRALHESAIVTTTYEGNHNHGTPYQLSH